MQEVDLNLSTIPFLLTGASFSIIQLYFTGIIGFCIYNAYETVIKNVHIKARKMNHRRILVFVCFAILIVSILFCSIFAGKLIQCACYDITLQWTMIGAMGSWAGAVFGAIALAISLFALWLPQKVKLKVEVSKGILMSEGTGIDKTDTYIITVKNVGMRAATIDNVYLNFGGRKMGDIFVGFLNQGTPLQMRTPHFPVRLDQGESFNYYLLRDKLVEGLKHYEAETPENASLFIRVDEVTAGTHYHKTKWTLKTFTE